MPASEPLNFSQPENKLSQIANAERQKLFPKNDYKTSNQYSATNPDAIADGDNQGAGAIQDILERKAEITINKYKTNLPYTTPSA